MATYPLAVKTFTQKKNLLDDVDASHINDIQSEIVALQSALGTTPTKDKASGVSYPSVDDRISKVRGGTHTNAFSLAQNATSFFLPPSNTGIYAMQLSQVQFDYGSMSNGTGVTCKEPGLYQLNAGLTFSSSPIRGTRNMRLKYSSASGSSSYIITASYTTQVNDTRWSDARVNGSLLWPLQVGDTLTLCAQLENDGVDSGKIQALWGRLNGFKVRDL